MPQKIENKSIFSPDFLEPQKKSFKEIIELIKLMESEMKDVLKVQQQLVKTSDKKSVEGLKKRQRAVQSVNQVSKEMLKLEKQRKSVSAQLAIAETKEAKAVAGTRIELQRKKKAVKDEILAEKGLIGEYKKQSTRLSDLRKRYKDLILVQGKETRQTRKLRNEALALDKTLKKLNASVSSSTGLFSKLKGGVARLGLAFGGLSLIKKGVTLLKDFDEGLADISKTTGLTIERARALSTELFKIDTRTSIAALQELAVAAGRLGIEGKDNIVGFVKAADVAFVALGDDLGGTADEIATSLGKVSNLFGLESELGIEKGILAVGSGLNELSANSKASAGAIADFTSRTSGLANIVELSDIQALGAFFDEAGQSIEVSSSTLGKLLPAIGKDLEKFSEIAGLTVEEFKAIADTSPIEALKLVAQGAKSTEGGLSGLADTMEKYGVNSGRAANVLSVLSNNTDRLTELQDLNRIAVENATSVTDEFETKNQTLGATYDKLVNAIQNYILGIDSAGNATGFLIDGLKFLTNNLGSIVSVLKSVAIGWLSYKAALVLVNKETNTFKKLKLVSFFRTMVKTLSLMTKGAKGASLGFRRMGAAMKTIPLAAWISGITTIVVLLWDFVDGTDAATQAQNELNEAKREELRLEKEKIKLSDEGRKQAQFDLKRTAALLQRGQEFSKEKLEQIKSEAEAEIASTSIIIDNLKIRQAKEKEVVAEKIAQRKAEGKAITENFISISKAQATIEVEQELGITETEDVKQLLSRFNLLKALLPTITKELEKQAAETKKSEANTKKTIINRKKELTGLDLLNKKLEKLNKLRKDAADATQIIGQQEQEQLKEQIILKETAAEKELQVQLDLAKENPEDVNVDKLEVLLNQRFDLIKRALEDERDLLLLNEELTAEERELIDITFQNKIAENERNRVKTVDDANNEIIDAQIETSDKLYEIEKQRRIQEAEAARLAALKKKQMLQDQLNALRDFSQKAIEIANAKTDKEIENIDKEVEASKNREEQLQALATQGNLDADKSIGAEIKRQAELERQKEALEKKKARRQIILEGLDLLSSKIDNGDKDAVTSTLNDMTRLLGALSALPGFIDGTETTVGAALGKPQLNTGTDDYIVRVDGAEKILNPSMSARTGNMTTEEITKAAEMYSSGMFDQNLLIHPKVAALNQPFQDNTQILKKFDSLENTIRNKPILADLKFDELSKALIITVEQNGDLRRKHYKLKK